MRIQPLYTYTQTKQTNLQPQFTPPTQVFQQVPQTQLQQIHWNQISFGYSHKLKSMWKDGLLPTVERGLYGGKLTKQSISLEHIIPHSQGGPTHTWNLALADRFLNSNRSNEPLHKFLTPQLAIDYLEQFRDVKIRTPKYKFTGNDYIRNLVHNFRRNGVDVREHFKDLFN